MPKTNGLDKIQKDLKEAEHALSELNGELGVVKFDPHDPASIEAAIQSINRTIDERTGKYSANPIIRPLANQMKETYRTKLLQEAAAARLQPDENK